MKRYLFVTVLAGLVLTAFAIAQAATRSVDISGAWSFSVDLGDAGHGEPTFTFKQNKETLTGDYDGPLGQYKVTGTVKENKAVFGFEFERDGEKHKATYTGTIESASKMTGTVEFSGGVSGTWTATKN